MESADSVWPFRHGPEQRPTVKTSHTHKLFSCPECREENSKSHPSGMTLEQSQGKCCLLSILFTAVSLVRTSARQDLERAWKGSEADFSSKSSGSLKKFDQLSSSLKMSQQSGHADLHAFSLSSPLYGMTAGGRLSLPQKLEPRTLGKDGSCLPTPCVKQGGYNVGGGSGRVGRVRPSLAMMARKNLWPTPDTGGGGRRKARSKANGAKIQVRLADAVGGLLNPTWVEWLMGYPLGWTALEDWATQWFRSRRARRSKG